MYFLAVNVGEGCGFRQVNHCLGYVVIIEKLNFWKEKYFMCYAFLNQKAIYFAKMSFIKNCGLLYTIDIIIK